MYLKPFKDCIGKELYDMYQNIPKEEIGSKNILNGIDYDTFLKKCKDFIEEENKINKDLNTATKRYILYDDIPIGEVGIRTTKNDFWINKGSQIYYKIRLSKRGQGYGNKILALALKEAKKLGFDKIRINCDNRNIKSKKVILKNGGVIDIDGYNTKEGISSSYIIEVKDKKLNI